MKKALLIMLTLCTYNLHAMRHRSLSPEVRNKIWQLCATKIYNNTCFSNIYRSGGSIKMGDVMCQFSAAQEPLVYDACEPWFTLPPVQQCHADALKLARFYNMHIGQVGYVGTTIEAELDKLITTRQESARYRSTLNTIIQTSCSKKCCVKAECYHEDENRPREHFVEESGPVTRAGYTMYVNKCCAAKDGKCLEKQLCYFELLHKALEVSDEQKDN